MLRNGFDEMETLSDMREESRGLGVEGRAALNPKP